jgi:hypothetical protein
MPPRDMCPEHEKLCRDVELIKFGTIENTRILQTIGDELKLIKGNHLKHLNGKLNFILWVVGLAFAVIAIMVGLFGAIISMNMVRIG